MKNQEKPLVSIILPIYNNSAYIQDCIKSLLSQTYRKIEIIVVDDYSRDSSLKLLKKLKRRYKRIHLFRNKKSYGFAVSLNRGLRRAKGQFITFMDAKDINKLARIKKQVHYLLDNPKTIAVGTQCVYINKKGRRLGRSNFAQSGLSTQFETIMLNRALLPKDILKLATNAYIPFSSDNKRKVFGDFFIKILPYSEEFLNLPDALYYRRVSPYNNLQKAKSVLSVIKLWTKSIILNDYRPSLTSLVMGTRIQY